MTNFYSSKRKKEIITPENSLLFLPIIIGFIILASFLTFIYRPLTERATYEEEKIKVLKEKISYIPLYKNNINKLSINLSKAKIQQERLIDLISDPQELETILSEINRISNNNDIEIINIVPKPIVKYTKPIINNSTDSSNNNSQDIDPFLIPKIEKHIFKLTLRGNFNSLLNFLKELELLQAIVISDKIDIKAIQLNSNKEKMNLVMSFNLSTYAKEKSKNKTNIDTSKPSTY